ncbi:hypothetical protein [Escherichia coli]|uniref:hypothetical protein n=1 Tax=Escherichia coli TaxID=562 RepID=UPI0021D1CF2E|nr:hypothetical protein [Escherichia coli]MCU6293956.1 hypothetical protein [Escherichia coli]
MNNVIDHYQALSQSTKNYMSYMNAEDFAFFLSKFCAINTLKKSTTPTSALMLNCFIEDIFEGLQNPDESKRFINLLVLASI